MARENYMQFVREGKVPSLTVALLLAAVLSACGGGSSGDSAGPDASPNAVSDPGTPPAAPPPAAPPPPPPNAALLSWDSPATLADGSDAAAIAGYRIYYGNSPGNYTNSVYVAGATVMSTLVTNLQLGTTWYFTVSAVDANGNESSFDYVVSKTL